MGFCSQTLAISIEIRIFLKIFLDLADPADHESCAIRDGILIIDASRPDA